LAGEEKSSTTNIDIIQIENKTTKEMMGIEAKETGSGCLKSI